MRINIIDSNICLECKSRRCSFLNVANTKQDFFNLPSETTVCVTQAIDENGPSLKSLEAGRIVDSKCVKCGLCVKNCPLGNLQIEDYNADTELLGNLTELQLKAVTSLYLSQIFEFSANTNRNNSLSFDGYVSTKNGEEAFVEIDYNNDSLESVRRILGDIVLYSSNRIITNGVIVLSQLPKQGSRDVYTVLEKLNSFPTTGNINIYMTTFSILRALNFFLIPGEYGFADLFFDSKSDDYPFYLEKVGKHLAQNCIGMLVDRI